MPTPFETQLVGARFLAARPRAILADMPRVGKTGTALIAADYVLADSLLIITTASGRAVWRRAVKEWCAIDRGADVLVLGWGELAVSARRALALSRSWSLLILDEAHYAKAFSAKRTQAVYGVPIADGNVLTTATALVAKAAIVWALTGTPMPNSPADLFPIMRSLFPDRLTEAWGPTRVMTEAAFMARYTITRPKKIGNFRWIDVVVGGRNEAELRARLDGLMLRRTQEDVGIRPPLYEIMPIAVPASARRELERDVDTAAVLAAAEAGETKTLEMHLGPLRRLTGTVKAPGVIEAVRDAFEGGLDKVVLMAWHRDVMTALADGLAEFGVVRLDGETPPKERETAEERFRGKARVFVGQIQAAGEAIDLSAAAELWFVEVSFTPKDMTQASLRITNHQQLRQAVVRVCALEGSVDEALQAILLRKWTTINEVMTHA